MTAKNPDLIGIEAVVVKAYVSIRASRTALLDTTGFLCCALMARVVLDTLYSRFSADNLFVCVCVYTAIRASACRSVYVCNDDDDDDDASYIDVIRTPHL